jgi:hypothetical protein
MTLDKIYLKLQVQLSVPFVFYIPSSIVPEDKKQVLETPVCKAVMDQIMLIEKNATDFRVLSAESVSPILTKAAVLDKNMFLLLKQKKKLSSSEFSFLLDKYSELLYFFRVISEWMSKNIRSLDTPLSKETAIYFESQHLALENHEQAFRKYFPLYKISVSKAIDWSRVTKNDFPPLAQLTTKEVEKGLKSILASDKKPAVKKEKKAPLLTDEQSQRYLLETVFNVKLE